MRFCRLRIHRTPTFDKEPIFMQCCFWASREESRDKNDIEPVVNQRLQDLPVGEKVGKTTYSGFLEPLSRISFAKQKTETFTNQGFRIMVGLVGLEPMTSTMSTWRSNQLSYNPILLPLLVYVSNEINYSMKKWKKQ